MLAIDKLKALIGAEGDFTENVRKFFAERNDAFNYEMDLKFKLRKYCRNNGFEENHISRVDQDKYRDLKQKVIDERKDFKVSKVDIIKLNQLYNLPPVDDRYYVRKVYCYLMYISGRRIGEIYKGGFRKMADKLWYTPLKKGDNAEEEAFELLDGVSVDRFLELYNSIKDKIQSQDKNTITRSMNRYIKKFFGHDIDLYKTHKLRGIYGVLHSESKEGSRSFNLQQALNHSNSESVKHYDYIKISIPSKDDVFCDVCRKILKKRSWKKHQTSKLHLKLKERV